MNLSSIISLTCQVEEVTETCPKPDKLIYGENCFSLKHFEQSALDGECCKFVKPTSLQAPFFSLSLYMTFVSKSRFALVLCLIDEIFLTSILFFIFPAYLQRQKHYYTVCFIIQFLMHTKKVYSPLELKNYHLFFTPIEKQIYIFKAARDCCCNP